MALKYFIEYKDVVNIVHRFELFDDNYTGDPIETNGRVFMDYGQVDENLEAIRGQGLRVELEADSNLTYEELFVEQEKTFKVVYYRDSVILFQGWLNPEGFFEDFVADKWIVSFDCIDGLGYLENLAFVNSDGTNITGVKTQLEILSLALMRTGINVDINVDIDIFYTGLADTNSILENVKINTRRYVKEDNNTISSCEDVIRDVLEPYGAVLTSYNGQWAIYKPNQLSTNTEATFFRYDYLGVALSPATVTFEFGFELGSQINDFYPHHCSGNQSFTNKPSFGAYRISYKYGLVKSLIENEDLYTLNGVDYDGFTIFNTGNVVENNPNSYGLTVETNFSGAFTQLISDSITAQESNTFEANLSFLANTLNGGGLIRVYTSIIIDGISSTNYLSSTGEWVSSNTSTNITVITIAESLFNLNINIPPLPFDGDLKIRLLVPRKEGGTQDSVTWSKIGMGYSESSNDINGEIFTFEREDKPSARIEKTREVLTGDSNLDIYEGTIYKADGVTPTETWYRKGVTEAVPILEMMGSETMRMNQNTMRIFSGDVFGYFNYLSIVTINGRAGNYGVTKYSYDTYSNIISIELKQVYSAELTDLDVDKTFDYGNVVEPTIKG